MSRQTDPSGDHHVADGILLRMQEDAARAPSISQATARAIFSDALVAYEDITHPCHLFRQLQVEVPDDAWQLPEPFNGRSAKAGIVFLGLNPSYDPREGVPTIRSPFEEWDAFYRARFDADVSRWHKLYRRYQAVGEVAIGSGFQLGIDGMVLEVIRFRSAAAEGCSDPGVLAHELPTTRLLLAELSPRVIVANGADALWAVQLLWPGLQDQLALRTPLLSVEHRCFELDVAWGAVAVVPTRHLSAAFGFRLDLLPALGQVVRSALER